MNDWRSNLRWFRLWRANHLGHIWRPNGLGGVDSSYVNIFANNEQGGGP